jgi:hypothetical protein
MNLSPATWSTYISPKKISLAPAMQARFYGIISRKMPWGRTVYYGDNRLAFSNAMEIPVTVIGFGKTLDYFAHIKSE